MTEDKMDRIRNLIDKFTEEMETDCLETASALTVINREEVDRAYAGYVATRLEGGSRDAPWFIQQTKMFVRALLLMITNHPDRFGDARVLHHSLELTKIALDTFGFRPVRATGKPAGYQEMGTNLSMTPKQAEELMIAIAQDSPDDTAKIHEAVGQFASSCLEEFDKRERNG